MAVFAWDNQREMKNGRVTIFCDNQAVVQMINNVMSSCHQCRKLIRLINLNGLVRNRHLFAKYITSRNNDLADLLSCIDYRRFWRLTPQGMNQYPHHMPDVLWPIEEKIWNNQIDYIYTFNYR